MHGGRLLEISGKLNRPVADFTDFSASINPYGLDSTLKKLLCQSIPLLEHYPNEDYSEVKELLGKKHNTDTCSIYLGNGANGIIYRFFQTFPGPLNICIPVPSFESYRLAAEAVRGNIYCYHMPDMRISKDIFEVLSKDINALVLTNPNNPTGFFIEKELLEDIAEYCHKHNIFVLLDECFLDFVTDGERYSFTGKIDKYNNIVILRSLTKLYAFPGLRFGYLLLKNEEIHKRLKELTPSWEINTLALRAAVFSLRQDMRSTVADIQKEKSILSEQLERLGIQVYPSQTNFILCRYSRDLSTDLMDCGIIVRNCSDFIGLDDRYFRISVRKKAENRRLIQAIKEITEDEANG